MDIDAVAPVIRGGDVRHGAIDRFWTAMLGRNGDDAVVRRGFNRIASANVDVVRPAIDTIDDDKVPVLVLVREAPRDHPANDPFRLRVGGIVNGIVARISHDLLVLHFTMHGLDDVTAFAHPAQCRFKIVRKLPMTGRNLFRQAEFRELLKASGAQALADRFAASAARPHQPLSVCFPSYAAVQVGQAILLDLPAEPVLDLQIGFWTQIEGYYLRRPLPHSMRDVFAGDNQIPVQLVSPPQNNMRMGMASIVVIDRDPIELGSQVFFHPFHETPHEGFQVFIFRAVLGRDDEAELVTVAFRPLDEALTVGTFASTVVKLSWLSVTGNAVALDVAKMQLGRFQPLTFELYDPGFDDDPAHPKAGIAVARRQHSADASTSTDPVAVKATCSGRRTAST